MISFDAAPVWAIFLGTLGLILGLLQVGFVLGRRRQQTATGKSDGAGAMAGTTLGLLAFMLAFTFNGAAGRFDARKMLVIEEANAIHQAWLRAGFLPDAGRAQARATLREYVDVRVKIAAGEIPVATGLVQVEQLLDQLWGVAELAGRTEPAAIAISQFVDSTNRVIDVHLRRLSVSIRHRVQPTIWATLYVLAGIAMLMMGAANGLAPTRQRSIEFGLAFAFSLVLFVIADLDRPQEGLINVSQQAMTELRDKLDKR